MTNYDLFGETQTGSAPAVCQVPELRYETSFVAKDDQLRIIEQIDNSLWNSELRRRVQHFGYKYDYKARSIDESMRAEPLPGWAIRLGECLVEGGFFVTLPDQVIVNEYLPGQGIAAHVDCVPCFGEVVASISFLSSCLMTFSHPTNGLSIDVDLEPGSAVLLAGESRFEWKHGIASRAFDRIGDAKRLRQRRVSATFRSVILKK